MSACGIGCFTIVADAAADCLRISRDGAAHAVAGLRRGSGPVQVVAHPLLPMLYVANAGNSTVTACHWRGDAGHATFAQAIRTVPPNFTAANTLAGIAISPDGRFLYAANRGHGSIATFAIQRGKGKMFLRLRNTLPGGPSGPPVLNPEGTEMAVPGETDMRFAVQPLNGLLAPIVPAGG